MTYDLIIVSSSTHKDLIRYTQQAIDTCCSEGEVNVILVETGQPYKYKDVNRYIEYNKWRERWEQNGGELSSITYVENQNRTTFGIQKDSIL